MELFYSFSLSSEFALSSAPFFLLFVEREATRADNVAHSESGILSEYIFIFCYVHPAERKRKDREVLFLSCPWLHCLCLAGCVRLGVFFLFFFSYFFFFFHNTQ